MFCSPSSWALGSILHSTPMPKIQDPLNPAVETGQERLNFSKNWQVIKNQTGWFGRFFKPLHCLKRNGCGFYDWQCALLFLCLDSHFVSSTCTFSAF
jgi:hypothetical protein